MLNNYNVFLNEGDNIILSRENRNLQNTHCIYICRYINYLILIQINNPNSANNFALKCVSHWLKFLKNWRNARYFKL